MVNIETITWVEDAPEKGIDVFFSNRNGILNIVEVSFEKENSSLATNIFLKVSNTESFYNKLESRINK